MIYHFFPKNRIRLFVFFFFSFIQFHLEILHLYFSLLLFRFVSFFLSNLIHPKKRAIFINFNIVNSLSLHWLQSVTVLINQKTNERMMEWNERKRKKKNNDWKFRRVHHWFYFCNYYFRLLRYRMAKRRTRKLVRSSTRLIRKWTKMWIIGCAWLSQFGSN